jgi:hypothetical protein
VPPEVKKYYINSRGWGGVICTYTKMKAKLDWSRLA